MHPDVEFCEHVLNLIRRESHFDPACIELMIKCVSAIDEHIYTYKTSRGAPEGQIHVGTIAKTAGVSFVIAGIMTASAFTNARRVATSFSHVLHGEDKTDAFYQVFIRDLSEHVQALLANSESLRNEELTKADVMRVLKTFQQRAQEAVDESKPDQEGDTKG